MENMNKEEILDEELEEDFEQYNDEETEEAESKEEKSKENQPTVADFKNICIKVCKGIIEDYIKQQKEKNTDTMFLVGVADNKKNQDECVNYIMNNLVKNKTFGGPDSLMYPFIHDYYVDDIKEKDLKDNWSSQIRTVQAQAPKVELSEEEKKELTKKVQDQFIADQKRKIEEAEKKKAEKAKQKAALKKAEEEKKKQEQEAEPLGGLFDLI